MSTFTASVTDVSRHFSDYLNRVAYSGDRFILVRGGKPLVELKACNTAEKCLTYQRYFEVYLHSPTTS